MSALKPNLICEQTGLAETGNVVIRVSPTFMEERNQRWSFWKEKKREVVV
jgi:hypothetical protein